MQIVCVVDKAFFGGDFWPKILLSHVLKPTLLCFSNMNWELAQLRGRVEAVLYI